VNGGLRDAASVRAALTWCDGVMLGREAYHRPFVLAELHQALAGAGSAPPARAALIERMARYCERELAAGEPLGSITRHMLGLYAGEPGAREFRRALSEGARAAGAGAGLLRQAIPTATRA
jgi:tRNA-dihydrouridine synthase A